MRARRFSDAQAAAIRAGLAAGRTRSDIARDHGVSAAVIGHIALGTTYATGELTCATPGCGAAITRQGKSGLCFRCAHSASMRRQLADPAFMDAMRAGIAARFADPVANPLAALTEAERRDYDRLSQRYGYRRDEALTAIGRADLVVP